mmetsp:Transcript_3312/g.5099  ORF Transcript_3312/g.5099 Transcript_3312/m.5099 type:complete len:259 (+) Transcript_3312:22-798(+)
MNPFCGINSNYLKKYDYYHVEGDIWLIPCKFNSQSNNFSALLRPSEVGTEYLGNSKRFPWSEQEDELLQNLVDQLGSRQWTQIAKQINSIMYNEKPIRQGRQCRERWINHLNPGLKKGSWTREEDITILQTQLEIGNKWSEIAKLLPGRNENSVKNRFKSMISRAEKQWPSDTDIVSALLASIKGQEIEVQEGNSIQLYSPVIGKRDSLQSHKPRSPPSNSEVAQVRNTLSYITSMDLPEDDLMDVEEAFSPSSFLSK